VYIERVLAPNPGPMTLTGTNTYLLSDGAEVAVVDPGPEIPSHVESVYTRATTLGRVTTVLVTHRHGDHLPAALPLCARTGAVLVGHLDLPGVHRPAADDSPVFGALRALATPGHTRESMCFFDPTSGVLFTGDLVAGSGTVIVDDTPGALSDYIGSLERLLTLQPRTMYPGHGPIVDDAIAKLHEYIEHRRKREQQVLARLSEHGPATIDELVAAIYPDLAPNLVRMAARNVRACLDKLAAEARVSAAGDRWTLSH
jgi:glyoxylase-like metal-dependent hydrolase (beta-lactamase superfamily II)